MHWRNRGQQCEQPRAPFCALSYQVPDGSGCVVQRSRYLTAAVACWWSGCSIWFARRAILVIFPLALTHAYLASCFAERIHSFQTSLSNSCQSDFSGQPLPHHALVTHHNCFLCASDHRFALTLPTLPLALLWRCFGPQRTCIRLTCRGSELPQSIPFAAD